MEEDMEPTGTKVYEGHQIRYYGSGSTAKINTEDFLAVVPAAAENLKTGDFNTIELEVAVPLASSSGDEDFSDWIHENFPRDDFISPK
jgi:hypothetical protein